MIYLTKRDPERNMARFYALDLQPTLFGGWAVVKEWGRIGRAGQGRSSLYGERAEAEAGLAHELQRRIRRGYKRGAVLERGELSALKEKSRICKASQSTVWSGRVAQAPMARRVQPEPAPSRTLVLRQNADADLP